MSEIVFGDQISLEDFRNDIKNHSKRNDEFIGVCFNRSTLKQTGAGHFSPIGNISKLLFFLKSF